VGLIGLKAVNGYRYSYRAWSERAAALTQQSCLHALLVVTIEQVPAQ
jgi:hypothetical protein